MMAIKDMHKPVTSSSNNNQKKVQLTNRALLPYYKVDEVRHFLDVFMMVDVDFSGDLDVNEWVKLFTSMNKSITPHQARMIFLQVDVSGDGYLSIKELIPIVFSKATKEQQKLIMAYADSEV
jgi:Ca2+-binding EF-hand superfamily protein